MSGSSKQTTTASTTPWAPASPLITGAMNDAHSAYQQAQGTISQFSPALNDAIGRIQQNIAHPPAYMGAAAGNLNDTINGKYLDPSTNPYSAGMAKLIADRTQGGYAATFGASGRSHGGLAALLSSQGVGDALGNFYGGIYNQERGIQNADTLNAPAFHQGEYTDINELFPAVANTAMLPVNAASAYGSAISGLSSPYNNQNSTTTTKQSMLPQILGAAMTGLSAFMPMPGAASAFGSVAAPVMGGGTSNYFAQHPFGGFVG